MVGVTSRDLGQPEFARLSFCDAVVDAKNIPGVVNLDGICPFRDGYAVPGTVIWMRHDDGPAKRLCRLDRVLDRHALRYVLRDPQYNEVPRARRDFLAGYDQQPGRDAIDRFKRTPRALCSVVVGNGHAVEPCGGGRPQDLFHGALAVAG